jgi:hypothetical protein
MRYTVNMLNNFLCQHSCAFTANNRFKHLFKQSMMMSTSDSLSRVLVMLINLPGKYIIVIIIIINAAVVAAPPPPPPPPPSPPPPCCYLCYDSPQPLPKQVLQRM